MVECNLAKVEVEGSNPFSRSIFTSEEKGFEESRVLMSCDLMGAANAANGRPGASESERRAPNPFSRSIF